MRRRRGEVVALREVRGGRVWSARPARVVEDEDARRMLWFAPGSSTWVAVGPDGTPLRLPASDWTLAQRPEAQGVLSFGWPDRLYAVLLCWDPEWAFRGWYVNVESPLRPTAAGFDFEDHLLDVLIEPDRSSWHWKDEDELEEALRRSLYSPADADAFRAAGRAAVTRIQEHRPPFDEPWEYWRPDPEWGVPDLPPGWDRV